MYRRDDLRFFAKAEGPEVVGEIIFCDAAQAVVYVQQMQFHEIRRQPKLDGQTMTKLPKSVPPRNHQTAAGRKSRPRQSMVSVSNHQRTRRRTRQRTLHLYIYIQFRIPNGIRSGSQKSDCDAQGILG